MRLWLKDIRTSHQKTQKYVANKAGISRSYYTRIESGAYTLPTETAKKIAKSLGFDWTRFYEDANTD